MLKKTDHHIVFQIFGNLSLPVVPTAHHAARIRVFGHETVRKIHKSNTNFSYISSLFLTSLSLCINYIKATSHHPK